jgi:hypothetical protein
MPIRRVVLPALMLAAALAALPAAASARTVRCHPGRYRLVDPLAFPGIGHLRAVDLPRRTDHYAPRCLVAEAIAADIQQFFTAHKRLPRRLHVFGARWDGGRWRLRYRQVQSPDNPFVHAVARKGRRRVTMDLLS